MDEFKDINKLYERRESSENVYDGKLLHVRRDVVVLPNNDRSVREYIEHGGASAVLPLTDDGDVILVRQYRYAIGEATLEIPAGKIDTGEDALTAAKRELREETGCRAETFEFLGYIHPSVAYTTEKIYLYLARGLKYGESSPDEDEFVETEKVSFKELLDMAVNGEITDSKTLVAVLKAARLDQTYLK